MGSELITHWTEHDRAVQNILRLTTTSLRIFDEDLRRLKLEQPENAAILHDFLVADDYRRLQIVIKNPEPLRRDSPRLMKLLAAFPLRMTVTECPQHLSALADSLFLVDEKHALIRFHKDSPRCRAIVDEADLCLPYERRFQDILNEGGEPVSATTLGL